MEILKDYNANLKWNIGSLFNHYEFVWYLLDICKKNLGLELPIKYVFGGTPCKFQGGRIFTVDIDSLGKINNIIDGYNKRGVACRLTFSNNLLTNEDLDDKLCNQMLQILEDNNGTYMKDLDNKNGVILSSDLLNEYIRENYPSLERVSSQIKPSVEVGLGPCRDDVNYYNNLFDSYDIIVINPMKAYDDDFLKKIKYPNRVEFIANCTCIPNCPRAKAHYESLVKLQEAVLLKDEKEAQKAQEQLTKVEADCDYTKTRDPLLSAAFTEDDIRKLAKLGFTQFKIEGRELPTIRFSHAIGTYIFNPNRYTSIETAIMIMGQFLIVECRQSGNI